MNSEIEEKFRDQDRKIELLNLIFKRFLDDYIQIEEQKLKEQKEKEEKKERMRWVKYLIERKT